MVFIAFTEPMLKLLRFFLQRMMTRGTADKKPLSDEEFFLFNLCLGIYFAGDIYDK